MSLCDLQAHTKDGPVFAAVSYLRAHAEHFKIVSEQMVEMVEISIKGTHAVILYRLNLLMCSLAYYLADMPPSSLNFTLNKTQSHDGINVKKRKKKVISANKLK